MPRSPPALKSTLPPKPEKIPRPPNAWIIYRTDRLRQWKAQRSPHDPPVKQADISRMIGANWKHEPDHIKLEYEKRAAIAKADHKRKYPDYKYNPMSKEAKEKMRSEEKEAKKKAREEAKAAKAAGRKVSSGSRAFSTPCTPSTSNVKLEVFDQAIKPLPAPEPINRGCGPSPPIDYDPESSSTAYSTPLLSSSSSNSIRSSPLPPSSSQPPSASLDAPHAPWLHALASPVSSPLAQPPPPAYPSGYVHSPAPSRQSSYNFTPAITAPSDVSSTPSDSPPSYTEGEGWHSQPPDSAYQTFTPLPESQGDWNVHAQYQPLLQPDLAFPPPVIDPLLSLPDQDAMNFTSTSTSTDAVFHLSSVQLGSALSPPGELDPEYLQQLFLQFGQPPLNSADQLAPVLSMPELHETIEDRADDAGVAAPTDAEQLSMEFLAVFFNSNPADAATISDVNFCDNLALQAMAAYSQGFGSMQPPPFSMDVNAAPVAQDFAMEQNEIDYQAFPGFTMEHQIQQAQLAMPRPIVPVTMEALSSVATSDPTQAADPTPASAHSPVSAHPESESYHAETTPAQASHRYVPPSGAGMPARRRVAGRFQPRRSNLGNDSD